MAVNVITYIKNVGRSFGYAAVEYAKEKNPAVTAMIESNEEFSKDLYKIVKNPVKSTISAKDRILNSEYVQIGGDFINNLMSDIKSGDWYNRERKDKYMNELLGFDDDFGDDGGDDESFDFGNDSDDSWDNNFDDLEDTVDTVGEKVSTTISMATARSANYIIKNQKDIGKIMFQQNNALIDSISKGLAAVNSSIATVVPVTDMIKTHADNAALFFTKTNEFQEKAISILQQIATNTAPNPPTNNNGVKDKSNPLDDLLGDEYVLNAKEYFNYVKNNIMNEFSDITGMGDMFKDENGKGENMFKQFTASPMEYIINAALGSLTPKSIKKSLERLNKSISGFGGSLLMKFSNMNNSSDGIMSKIGEYFGVRNNLKKYINTSDYNKGKVDFDGITRKSITEVIPTLLSKIYSALSGKEEIRYDYNKGEFINESEIYKLKNKLINRSADYIGGDLDDELDKQLENVDDVEKSNRYKKEYLTLRKNLIEKSKIFNHRENYTKNQFNEFGISEDFGKFISDIIRNNESLVADLPRETMEARKDLTDLFNREEKSGTSILTSLYNKSLNTDAYGNFKKDDKSQYIKSPLDFNNMRDQYKRNVFYYLQGIYQYTQHLSDNVGIVGSGDISSKASKITPIKNITKDTEYIDRTYSTTANDIYTEEEYNKLIYTYKRYIPNNKDKSEDYKDYMYMSKKDKEKYIKNIIEDTNKYKKISKNGNSLFDRLGIDDEDDSSIIKQITNAYNKIINKPVELVNKVLKKADKAIYDIIYGNPEKDATESEGFLSIIFTKTKNMFTEFYTWVKDSIFKPLTDKIKNFDFKKSVNKLFGNISNYITSTTGFDFKTKWNDILDKLLGLKDETGKRKNGFLGDMVQKTKDEFVNVGKWVANAYKSTLGKGFNKLFGRQETGEVDGSKASAATGGQVTKTGMIAVSEGEMIIPSELNPYYKGITNKKQQQKNEYNAAKKFYGFANLGKVSVGSDDSDESNEKNETLDDIKDTVKNNSNIHKILNSKIRSGFLKNDKINEWIKNESLSDEDKEKLNKLKNSAESLFSQSITELASGIITVKNKIVGKGDNKSTNKDIAKIKTYVGDTLEEITDKNNIGGVTTGAIMGGIGLPLLTGGIIGPIIGASIGAATGLTLKSKKIQTLLFGDEDKKGLLPKKVSDFIQKNVPDMAKFGSVGMGLSLIPGVPGGPLVGLLVGSAVGYASKSDKVKRFLFGDKDVDGKVFSKDFQERIKKALPRMTAGAIAGLVAGPFGLVGNVLAGSAVGYATTSERFTKMMFGENEDGSGGLVGWIKQDIFEPVKDAIKPLSQELRFQLKKAFKSFSHDLKEAITVPFKKLMESYLFKPLGKVFGKIINPLKDIISSPFRAVGNLGRKVREKQIRNGQASDMTAAERNEYRDKYDIDEKNDNTRILDQNLASMSESDLTQLQKTLKAIDKPSDAITRDINTQYSNLSDKLSSNSSLSAKQIKDILKSVRDQNDPEQVSRILDKSNKKAYVEDLYNQRDKEYKNVESLLNNSNLRRDQVRDITNRFKKNDFDSIYKILNETKTTNVDERSSLYKQLKEAETNVKDIHDKRNKVSNDPNFGAGVDDETRSKIMSMIDETRKETDRLKGLKGDSNRYSSEIMQQLSEKYGVDINKKNVWQYQDLVNKELKDRKDKTPEEKQLDQDKEQHKEIMDYLEKMVNELQKLNGEYKDDNNIHSNRELIIDKEKNFENKQHVSNLERISALKSKKKLSPSEQAELNSLQQRTQVGDLIGTFDEDKDTSNTIINGLQYNTNKAIDESSEYKNPSNWIKRRLKTPKNIALKTVKFAGNTVDSTTKMAIKFGKRGINDSLYNASRISNGIKNKSKDLIHKIPGTFNSDITNSLSKGEYIISPESPQEEEQLYELNKGIESANDESITKAGGGLVTKTTKSIMGKVSDRIKKSTGSIIRKAKDKISGLLISDESIDKIGNKIKEAVSLIPSVQPAFATESGITNDDSGIVRKIKNKVDKIKKYTTTSSGDTIEQKVNDDGELVADISDKETRKAIKDQNSLKAAQLGLFPAVTGISSLLIGWGKKLFGDKEEKHKSSIFDMFSNMFGGIVGKNGLISKVKNLFNYFTGKGKYSTLFTAIKAIGLPILFAEALKGKFDGLVNDIVTKVSGSKESQMSNVTTNKITLDDGTSVDVQVDEKGNPIKDDNGDYIDKNGTSILGSDGSFISVEKSGRTFSDRLKENTGRGLISGKSVGGVVAATAIKNGAKLLGKDISGSALTKSNTYSLKGISDFVVNNTDDVVLGISGSLTSIISKMTKGIVSIAGKIPGLSKYADSIQAAGAKLSDSLLDVLCNNTENISKVASTLSSIASTIAVVLKIADFITGFQDARTTFGIISEPSFGLKIASGMLRLLKNCIPIIGTLIPDKTLVNIFLNYIAPVLGVDTTKIEQERSDALDVVQQYNDINGTNYTVEDYNKQVLGHYTFTEKIGNFAKTIVSNVKEKGIIGAAKSAGSEIGNSVTRFGKNAINTVKNVGSGISKFGGNIVSKAKDIYSNAKNVAGNITDKASTFIKDKINDYRDEYEEGGASEVLETALRDMLSGSLGDIAGSYAAITKLAWDGKPVEMMKYSDKNDDKSTFTKIIKNIALSIPKIGLAVPSVVMMIGHKITDTIKGFIDKVGNWFGMIKDNISQANKDTVTSLSKGVTFEDWFDFSKYKDDEGNPLSGINKAIIVTSRIALTGVFVVRAAFNHFKDWITKKIKAVSGDFNTFGKTTTSLLSNTLKGNVEQIRSTSPTYNKEDPISGMFNTVTSVIKFAVLPVSVIVNGGKKIFSWISDKVKAIKNDLSTHSKGNDGLMSLALKGDKEGVATYSTNYNEDNPLNKIFSVLTNVAKTILFPIAVIVDTGKKIFSWISEKISAIKQDGTLFGTNISTITKSAFKGNKDEVMSFNSSYNDNDPIHGMFSFLTATVKVVMTPVAMTSNFVGKIFDWISEKLSYIKSDMKTYDNYKNTINNYASSGKLSEMFAMKFTFNSSDPINGVFGFISNATRIVMTPVAVSVSAFKYLSEKLSPLITDAKSALNISTITKSVSDKVDSDNISDLWGVKSTVKSNNPFKPLNNILMTTAKLIMTPVWAVNKLMNIVGGVVDKIKDKISGVWGKFINWLGGGDSGIDLSEADKYAGGNSGINKSYSGGNSNSDDGTFISQSNNLYSNLKYAGSNIAEEGCGPTVAAMAINSIKSKVGGATNVKDTANYAKQKGYETDNGTTSEYFNDIFSKYGIKSDYVDNTNEKSKKYIAENISRGNPTVLLGNDISNKSKKNSPFGKYNHYVVAEGTDENGNIIVNDPEGSGTRIYSNNILDHTMVAIPTLSKNSKKGSMIFNGGSTLSGDSDPEMIWNYLRGTMNLTENAASGIMGNLSVESGLRSNNLQNTFEKKLGYSDESYTNAVDNGTYSGSSFINDSAGYGLPQYTYNGYKKQLYDRAKQRGVSISDLGVQLDVLNDQLTSEFPSLLQKMNNAGSATEASDLFLYNYERPGNPEGSKAERRNYANSLLSQFTGSSVISNPYTSDNSTSSTNTSSSSSTSNDDDVEETAWSKLNTLIGNLSGDIFGSSISSLFGLSGTQKENESSTTNGVAESTSSNASTQTNNTATSSDSVVSSNIPSYSPSTTSGLSNGQSVDSGTARSVLVNAMNYLYNHKIAYSQQVRNPDAGAADCSSTVQWAYKNLGIDPGGYTGAQITNGSEVDTSTSGDRTPHEGNLKPGDLLFYRSPSSGYNRQVGHVEMYVGNNQLLGHGGGSDGTVPGPTLKTMTDYRTNESAGTYYIAAKRFVNDGSNYTFNNRSSLPWNSGGSSGLPTETHDISGRETFTNRISNSIKNNLSNIKDKIKPIVNKTQHSTAKLVSGKGSNIQNDNKVFVNRAKNVINKMSGGGSGTSSSIDYNVLITLIKSLVTLLTSVNDNTEKISEIFDLLEAQFKDKSNMNINISNEYSNENKQSYQRKNKTNAVDEATKEMLNLLNVLAQG